MPFRPLHFNGAGWKDLNLRELQQEPFPLALEEVDQLKAGEAQLVEIRAITDAAAGPLDLKCVGIHGLQAFPKACYSWAEWQEFSLLTADKYRFCQ